MKTKRNYCLFVLLMMLVCSCGSSKTSSMNNPCECYKNNEDNIISYSAVGESFDEMYSKTKALSDARIGLASLIESRVLSIGNKFEEAEKINTTEDLTIKRKQATRLVVERSLSNIRVSCEQTIKTDSGSYKTYICLEIKADVVDKSASTYYREL